MDGAGAHAEAVVDGEVEEGGAHGGVPEGREGLQRLQHLVGALRSALQQQHLEHAHLHMNVWLLSRAMHQLDHNIM